MKKKNKFNKYHDLIISASKYMSNYYNIKDKNLNKLSHKDLKEIFPELISVNFGDITEEKVFTGEILLVIDSENIILGYINPYLKDYEEHYELCEENEKINIVFVAGNESFNIGEIDDEILKELSLYELKELRKIVKRNKKHKTQRLVQTELYFRKENHNTKHEKQEKCKIREMRKEELE